MATKEQIEAAVRINNEFDYCVPTEGLERVIDAALPLADQRIRELEDLVTTLNRRVAEGLRGRRKLFAQSSGAARAVTLSADEDSALVAAIDVFAEGWYADTLRGLRDRLAARCERSEPEAERVAGRNLLRQWYSRWESDLNENADREFVAVVECMARGDTKYPELCDQEGTPKPPQPTEAELQHYEECDGCAGCGRTPEYAQPEPKAAEEYEARIDDLRSKLEWAMNRMHELENEPKAAAPVEPTAAFALTFEETVSQAYAREGRANGDPVRLLAFALDRALIALRAAPTSDVREAKQPDPSDAGAFWHFTDYTKAEASLASCHAQNEHDRAVIALDAVAHRLREAFEEGFRTGEVTNAFVEDEMQESIGKFKTRIASLEAERTMLNGGLNAAEQRIMLLEDKLRAAREATGGDVTYEDAVSFLREMSPHGVAMFNPAMVRDSLTAFLAQRACRPAPKAAAPKGRSAKQCAELVLALISSGPNEAVNERAALSELVALAERREVPPAVAEVLAEMEAHEFEGEDRHGLGYYVDKIRAALAGRQS